jgi:D-3-phosphoglycerate dehydrogenase
MKIKDKVLLTHPIHSQAMAILENAVEEIVIASGDSKENILGLIDDQVLWIIVRFGVVIDRDVMTKGKNLKVIARHAVGTELIDLQAAAEAGIQVVNTPRSASASVAEHVLMFILVLAKNLRFADQQLRLGNYDIKNKYGSDDIEGKRIGIVGFGRIGQELAKRCNALGMEVLIYNRSANHSTFDESNVVRCRSLEEMLEGSDYVSLHVPLTQDTYHMFGEKQFACMKNSACFINCSRGEVVDEAALIKAIKEKQIAGAALDVFEEEPPDECNPLFTMENVIFTPHKAALTLNGIRKMSMDSVEQLLKVLRNERPDYLVNKGVK